MDRYAVLVADEGMRILTPDVITTAPYFLASNEALWDAWREIQAGHRHFATEQWIERGWQIRPIKHLPNGGAIMTLLIRFDPMEDK